MDARPSAGRAADGLALLAAIQASYFLATGLWPLLHMDSFLAVTGPKTDLWLVQTVAVLISAVGAALLVAALRGAVGADAATLAVGSAAGLGAIDVLHVAEGTISPVYLGDAAVQAALLLAWGVLLRQRAADRRRRVSSA